MPNWEYFTLPPFPRVYEFIPLNGKDRLTQRES